MLVHWSYFWTANNFLGKSKFSLLMILVVFFAKTFLSFEEMETCLASAFLLKMMSFPGRKLASWSCWQGHSYVDYRKTRGFNWIFKVPKLLYKILLHLGLIVSAISHMKMVWCSSAACWWCKDLKSLALPLEPVLTPWVKSTNKIKSLRKKNNLCYLHHRFYCKIFM